MYVCTAIIEVITGRYGPRTMARMVIHIVRSPGSRRFRAGWSYDAAYRVTKSGLPLAYFPIRYLHGELSTFLPSFLPPLISPLGLFFSVSLPSLCPCYVM